MGSTGFTGVSWSQKHPKQGSNILGHAILCRQANTIVMSHPLAFMTTVQFI